MIHYNVASWNIVFPAVAGINLWLAGLKLEEASSPAHVWPLDPRIPRKLHIVRCRIGHQAQYAPGRDGQFAAAIDYGKLAYLTGAPPWHQQKPDGSNTDWNLNTTLCSLFIGPNEPQERTELWPTPAFVDLDKDALWFQQDGSFDQFFCQIQFLVPRDPHEPVPLILPEPPPPPPPPEPGWTTIAGPASGTGDADYNGYTFTTAIAPSALLQMTGTRVRVTLEAGSTGFNLSKLYIGPRLSGFTASALHQMTIDGNPAAPPNGFVQATIDQDIDTSNGVVIRGYGSGWLRSCSSVPGFTSGYAAGDHASETSQGAFMAGSAATNGVVRAEKFMS